MPTAALKALAEKHGVSLKTAERYWDDAKRSAKGKDIDDKYAYMMGIVKRRMEASLDLEDRILARMCVNAGYIGDYVDEASIETAAGKPVSTDSVKKGRQQGAEKRLTNPPKIAYKIFSTENPFDVEGLKYAEFKGKGIEHAAYDSKTTSLWISFSGQELHRWYWYQDVPIDVWNKFRRVSVNAIVFFNKEIRPIYDYALIEKD